MVSLFYLITLPTKELRKRKRLFQTQRNSSMNVEKYLERIGCQSGLEPTLEMLSELQTLHMQAVPFEDLNIHHNLPIVLKEDHLYKKIVKEKRGGFCYELNGLFAWMLGEVGFKAEKLSASVINDKGVFGPAFDHMALLVHLDEDYLVDVGFGDSFQKPLRFNERGEQNHGSMSYQIAKDGDTYILLEQDNRDAHPTMQPQYRFDLQPRGLNDYQERCDFFQYSPESSFRKKTRCSRATPDGRITIFGSRLIVTKNNVKEEKELGSEEEIAQALKEHFGIVMPRSTSTNVLIRVESQNDFEIIAHITESAFKGKPYADGTEPLIIQRLREENALPLSLVAEVNGKVVGHAAFSSVMIDGKDQGWYGLGPISVAPELQKQGVGSQLIRKGLSILHEQGACGCVLEGDPNYYRRFGFRSYPRLYYEGAPDPKYFMALPFYYQEVPEGKAEFHKAFYN
jgi:N-hydroxyarylamine O-acetyltransferase